MSFFRIINQPINRERIFIRFLKENKMFNNFATYFAKDNNLTFSQYCRTCPMQEYFVCAFDWGTTHLSSGYWCEANNKWKTFLDKNLKI